MSPSNVSPYARQLPRVCACNRRQPLKPDPRRRTSRRYVQAVADAVSMTKARARRASGGAASPPDRGRLAKEGPMIAGDPEAARAESEALYRLLADNLSDLIVRYDAKGVLLYVS